MNNYRFRLLRFRLLAPALLVAATVGCQVGGTLFRDSVDVMATPVLWLSKSDTPSPQNPNGSFNSDTWTSSRWGPKD